MNGTSRSSKRRVGVLRGGPSQEYQISLQSGAHIIRHMPEGYTPVDIFISRDGAWHVGGMQRAPESVLPHVDVIWNALHGSYGEDGKVQTFLEQFKMPYTGSRPLASAFGMNKNISKAAFAYHGLKTPEYTVIHPGDNSLKSLVSLFQSLPQPSIIKPLSGGSSFGITLARDFEEFKNGIERAFKEGSAVVIEEYIDGIEIASIVIEGSDRETLFSLIPLAPGKTAQGIFDYEAKYVNPFSHTFPAGLSHSDEEAIQNIALAVHKSFDLRHYSIVDVIVHPKRGIYLLEVNTLPGLTESSLLPKTLSGHGVAMDEFIGHVLELALQN